MSKVLINSNLKSLPLIGKGKVRDIYRADAEHLLIVTTDRISAFDVVLATGIPGKGRILSQMAKFWFDKTKHIIANHLVEQNLSAYLTQAEIDSLDGRAMLVKKLQALPIEAVVRAYLAGSGWQDYKNSGAVCGVALPPNLKLAQKLPQPIYTPATKAQVGDHDENISLEKSEQLIGKQLAAKVKQTALELYQFAAAYAYERGIIIADTKFEFGTDKDGNLILIDEVLTPDSSRFWAVDNICVGQNPPSFDKQYVRDYLIDSQWDKNTAAPQLPATVVANTIAKYRQAYAMLSQ